MLPTLTDLKAELNITSTSDDTELDDTLDRAVAILEKRVGPLTSTIVTDEIHTGPGPIVLNKTPVQSVTAATSSAVAVSDLDLDAASGLLYGSFGRAPRGVKVTYVAGYDDVPEDLALAVLEMARHLWKTQRGGGSLRPAFPGEAESDAPPTAGYLLPYRVESLIEPYRMRVMA